MRTLDGAILNTKFLETHVEVTSENDGGLIISKGLSRAYKVAGGPQKIELKKYCPRERSHKLHKVKRK